MNKDELINRVVLLKSTLTSALQEGEETFTRILNQPKENVEAVAEYFKETVRNPTDYEPLYKVVITIGTGQYISIQTKELKIVTTYE